MGVEVSGLLGLLILIADIWAIVNIVQAPVSAGARALWCALVLLLPIVGLLVWLMAGPRGAATA
jgi:hypothetical protein